MQRSEVIRKLAKIDKTKDNIVPPEITSTDGLRDKHESIAPENHLVSFKAYLYLLFSHFLIFVSCVNEIGF